MPEYIISQGTVNGRKSWYVHTKEDRNGTTVWGKAGGPYRTKQEAVNRLDAIREKEKRKNDGEEEKFCIL